MSGLALLLFMLIVTGTIRSGTSLWMQVLNAAGYSIIGSRFPEGWGEVLKAANPDGFYESTLVSGIYYRTNPSPENGAYLFPDETRRHAVKVFIPGLLRTELGFINQVIATVREWRQYCASVERMRALGGEAQDSKKRMPSYLTWWYENFALIRDLATRRYPAHFCSYQSLLDDPARQIAGVLKWLGGGDIEKAVAQVDASKQSQRDEVPTPEGLKAHQIEAFDELYDTIHRAKDLSNTFIRRLNAIDGELQTTIVHYQSQTRERMMAEILSNELHQQGASPGPS